MDSETLEKLLSKDPKTRPLFKGVFSRDNLPLTRVPGLYIVNEDPSYETGSHWVALHITPAGEKNIYFDSYGRKPVLREFRKFLGKRYVHNQKRLQHMLSTSCGQWCIYFVWRRSEQWKLPEINRAFKVKKPLVNDYVVNYLVEKRFKTDQDVLDRKFLTGQISKQMKEVINKKLRKK